MPIQVRFFKIEYREYQLFKKKALKTSFRVNGCLYSFLNMFNFITIIFITMRGMQYVTNIGNYIIILYLYIVKNFKTKISRRNIDGNQQQNNISNKGENA